MRRSMGKGGQRGDTHKPGTIGGGHVFTDCFAFRFVGVPNWNFKEDAAYVEQVKQHHETGERSLGGEANDALCFEKTPEELRGRVFYM